MLSIATLIVATILLLLPSVGFPAIVALVAGAAALAIVAPFEAMDPAARRRVLIATIVHLAASVAALGLVVATDGGNRPLVVIAGLAAASVILVGWAFKTRNRRRRVGWNNYYD
jgi:hypothetical protein